VAGERARSGRWPMIGHAPGTVGGSLLLERRRRTKRKGGIRTRSAIVRGEGGVWSESILVTLLSVGVQCLCSLSLYIYIYI